MLSLLLLFNLLPLAFGIPTISAKGAKLFTSDGAQFYIKGIAYQLTNSDPLADTQQCQLDAALMKTLGTNSIRVYHVQANLDHDGCMTAFADAGIYAWIDLDTFDTYILPDYVNPDPMWTQSMFANYSAVMDAFQKYDNTAGFFVGNEMLNNGQDSVAAPYIKAAARDMKTYRNSKGYRDFPIGYSAADIPALRPNLQNYLACGDNPADALDFYSLNAYEWCGTSGYVESGYDILQKNASDYNIPIFFSETGCNNPEPRYFDDQHSIFTSPMDNTWSGAIIYEWVQVVNNFGLVEYGPDNDPSETGQTNVYEGFTVAGTPTPIAPDFTNLQNQWATLTPTGVSRNAYTPSLSPPPCPSYTAGYWEVSGNVALPTLNLAAMGYTKSTAPTGTAGSASGAAASSKSSATASKNAAAAVGGKASPDWVHTIYGVHPARYWAMALALAIFLPMILL